MKYIMSCFFFYREPLREMSPASEVPEPLQTLHERLYQAAVNGEAQKISELLKLGAKMSADEVSILRSHLEFSLFYSFALLLAVLRLSARCLNN